LVGSKLGRFARRPPLGDERAAGFSFLGHSLSDKLLVGSSFFLVSEDAIHLLSLAGTLALQCQRSHQTLNLGGLAAGDTLLAGKVTVDDILADIVVLGQVEKLANVVGTLGTQTTGDGLVRQTLDSLFSHLGDDQVQNGNIVTDNTSTDRLALSLTLAARSVGLVSLLTEKTDSRVCEDTLTHGEPLLVVSTRNAEDVSVKVFTEDATVNFLGHTAFVQVLETLFIIDVDDFLLSSAGASNIDLEEERERR
jgi:hypothetical protein